MSAFKKLLGVFLLILAPLLIFELVNGAIHNINTKGTKDINNPVIWVVIITIFIPIAVGLVIFGWYAFGGEYDELPSKSKEI
jgi:putative copper export protein